MKDEDLILKIDYVQEAFDNTSEQVFREILKQVLGREPVPKDAERLILGRFPNEPHKTYVAFDGHEIGVVETRLEGLKVVVEFTPCKDFEASSNL